MKRDDERRVGTKHSGDSGQTVMSMNDVVLHATSPLANLDRSFQIRQLGTVSLKVQDIYVVFPQTELLDLLHNKGTLTRPLAVRVHRRNKKDGERHITIAAKVPFQPWLSGLE